MVVLGCVGLVDYIVCFRMVRLFVWLMIVVDILFFLFVLWRFLGLWFRTKLLGVNSALGRLGGFFGCFFFFFLCVFVFDYVGVV